MSGPVVRLRSDLSASGLTRDAIDAVAGDYACALRSRTTPAWEAFYRSLYAAVSNLGPARGERAVRARLALRSILTDDLGAALFAGARADPDPPPSRRTRRCEIRGNSRPPRWRA